MSYAASPDGAALAVSLLPGDSAGARTGIVDLTQLPHAAVVRAWKPTGIGPGHIEWTADGRIVSVHGGAVGSADTASLAGRTASVGSTDPRAALPPGRAPTEATPQTQAVSWSMVSGDVTLRSVGTNELLPSAASPGGRYLAILKLGAASSRLPQARYRIGVEVLDSLTLRAVYDVTLRDFEGRRHRGRRYRGVARWPARRHRVGTAGNSAGRVRKASKTQAASA